MAIADRFTRRFIDCVAERDDDAVCGMFSSVQSGMDVRSGLKLNNDPLFRFHGWLGYRRTLDIEHIKFIA